ncbi:MAG: hypothetical protein RQ741_10750, partial [Wenzhouxiangellaceae bacterium]|nr:hypothetical protein [Wenzhouxiangellaceae bacterium]
MNFSFVPGQMRPTSATVRAASFARLLSRCLVMAAIVFAGPATAALTLTPITWDLVGLDHNRPLTEGPELFPVGARVCSDADTTDPVRVDHVWDNPDDTWIDNRPGSLTSLTFDPLLAGECRDAYFELQLTRGAGAFGQSRAYRIVASTDGGSVTGQTPTPRQIFVERLVSQNRNATQQIRWGQQADQSDWQILGAGAGLSLLVGETYFIELTTQTATAYEQIESFLTLSNTIFQVKSVDTTYSVKTAPDSRIPVPNPSLYGDACLWEPDPGSPNYLSCLAAGKAGGVVVTTYEIDIITGGGASIGLEALIYDLSGGSFHYNTDFSQSPGEALIFDSTDATFTKRFIPDTIGADGIAKLRLTIGNPNPVVVGGYSFSDNLPGNMLVANPANASSSCGGTLTASAGSGVIDFDSGVIDANSSCTILVDVTVPFDPGALYPLALLNSVDLFVGDAPDPSATAQATLNVTEEPPPPLSCTLLAAGTDVAAWNSFNVDLAPAPTFQFAAGIASAQGGPGLTFNRSNDFVEWLAFAQVTGQTLAAARSTNAFYEFRLDTTGLVSVDLGFEAFRRNGNAPASITLDYGPAGGSLVQSTTLSPVPTRNSRPGVPNFLATGLTNLNPNGDTVFRVFAYGASNVNQPVSLLAILFEAEGEICSPATPGDELAPPALGKQFVPDTVAVGEVATLTFTIDNPNPADALSGITFRDEFPAGMTSVGGFFNNGCGGTWGLEGGNSSIVSFSDGTLAGGASCTLAVNVRSTTVGANLNVSDPVDAVESFPGNSAVDTLNVTPPPLPPSIVKLFDPNPLFDANGSTSLVFQITNNDPFLDITSVSFTDTLPTVAAAQMQPLFDPIVIADNGNCGPLFSFSWDPVNFVLQFTDGEIPAGQVCEIEVEVEVPGLDLDPETGDLPAQFPNQTSSVSHIFNGLVFEGNQAEATLLVDNPIPGIAMFKQVGLTNAPEGAWSDYLAAEVPTDVFYKLTVENIGETVLDNIVVNDPAPDVDPSGCPWAAPGFTLPVADFSDPEAHISVCIIGPVTINSAGVFPNTATAEATGNGLLVEDMDSATVATAELGLLKQADRATFDSDGETINYSFSVQNTGAAILSGPVAITDPLIQNALCPTLNTIGNNDNYFDPGEVLVCSGSYVTTSADVSNGQVQNTASASTPELDSPDSSVTVVLAVADLTITKTQTGGPSVATANGQVIDYTIVVENTGTVSQTGVNVTDTLPDDNPGTLTGPAESISADGVLAATETWTYMISYTVSQADLNTGADLINSASVSTTEVPGPTTDTAVTPVMQSPALIVSKALTGQSADPIVEGTQLTYTITASNSGNVALTNVVVSDPLLTPASEICASVAVAGSCVLTGSYTVTAADVTAGSISNTGTADSDQTDPLEDTVVTPVEGSPALIVSKALTGQSADPI